MSENEIQQIMPNDDKNQNSEKKPVISKTKIIRANISGDDFLNFHAISGRVVFSDKLNERNVEEELVKIALRRLRKEIEKRVKAGEVFIDANSL